MRWLTAATLLLTAATLLAPPPAEGQEDPEARFPGLPGHIKLDPKTAGHDVLEARFLLVTPPAGSPREEGFDLRLRHLLGDRADQGPGRFFAVSNVPDPETIVRNLGSIGAVRVLDRANLPLSPNVPTRYYQGTKIPVPTIERRGEQEFVRTNFQDIGSKLQVIAMEHFRLQLEVEISFVLGHVERLPVIAAGNWKTSATLRAGETAVLRSQYRLPEPPSVRHGEKELPLVAEPGCRTLVVLLTRSDLP